MKIAILTAMHGRHELNKIFASAMARIRNNFGIQTYVATTVGDQANASICVDNGFGLVCTKNNFVSNKLNKGLELLFKDEWTHVMILGSDDFPSNKLIEEHLKHPYVDFLALSDLWFWGLNPKRAGYGEFMYWHGGSARIGAGRLISRKVIEALDYQLWPNGHNGGLDGKSARRIRGLNFDLNRESYSLRDKDAFMVDVKYETNISSLSPIMTRGDRQDPKIIWDHLPPVECEQLLRLREKVKNNE